MVAAALAAGRPAARRTRQAPAADRVAAGPRPSPARRAAPRAPDGVRARLAWMAAAAGTSGVGVAGGQAPDPHPLDPARISVQDLELDASRMGHDLATGRHPIDQGEN